MNGNERIDQYIEINKRRLENKEPFSEEMAFFLGNCYLRKKEYSIAEKFYQKSINACFGKNCLWSSSGQANWLIDILILSKKFNLVDRAKGAFDIYFSIPGQEKWPVIYYAYAVIDLLQQKNQAEIWINKLLNDSKNQEVNRLGKAFKAILNDSALEFNHEVLNLLDIHDKKVKYGSLRETPEGLIYMSGMSLIYLARNKNIPVTIDSKYILPDYFDNNY